MFKIFIKQIVEYIYGLYQSYLTNNEAFDELIEDPRDYELLGGSVYDSNITSPFIFSPTRIINQNKPGYKMSCTAQSTTEASNTIRKIKADKTRYDGFKLWDYMVSVGLGHTSNGAYLIHAIQEARNKGYIDSYYRIRNIGQLITSIYYNSDLIVTGSTKINRTRLKKTNYIVDKIDKGSGHAFYINGFDLEKKLVSCVNSYGEEYGDKGQFYIPFDLFFDICFNSTYAVKVNPEWTKLTKEELFEKYSIITTY